MKSAQQYESESKWVNGCLVHPSKKSVARKLWQLRHGKLSSSLLEVCHTCDNPFCILDAHHFVGTQADNMRDASTKGRMSTGHPISDATRAKISKTKRSKNLSMPEHVKTILRAANSKRILSDTQRAEISARFKGRPSPMKGRHHSEETKAKIGAWGVGRIPSPETLVKRSVALKGRVSGFLGKHHTEESRQKIREAAIL